MAKVTHRLERIQLVQLLRQISDPVHLSTSNGALLVKSLINAWHLLWPLTPSKFAPPQ